MSADFHFRWLGPVFESDDRHVLMVGGMQVGAVFAPAGLNPRYTRWRCWLTKNANPVEGVSASLEIAKGRVEGQVREALALLAAVPE